MGRVKRIDLIDHIEKKKLMSHATAAKAIDEAVLHNKIIREEEYHGKQKIVFLTVYADIAKDQQYLLAENEKWLKSFDSRFSFFEKKFSSLTIEEKAAGIDLVSLLLLHFQVTVETLWRNFGKTRKWQSLLDEIQLRVAPINKLLTSCSNKEHGMIGNELIEMKFFHLGEIMKAMDEYLKIIK